MKVEITMVVAPCSSAVRVVNFIDSFSDNYIAPFFKDRSYGNDVKEIIIFVNLSPVRDPSEYPVTRPRYIAYKERPAFYRGIDGSIDKLITDRRFYYDSVICGDFYYEIMKAPEQRMKQILAKCVVDFLYNIDRVPKRLKDFDREAFKADMIGLLRSLDLID